jgi:hypothetical protein
MRSVPWRINWICAGFPALMSDICSRSANRRRKRETTFRPTSTMHQKWQPGNCERSQNCPGTWRTCLIRSEIWLQDCASRLEGPHIFLRPRPDLHRLLRCHLSLQANHLCTVHSFNLARARRNTDDGDRAQAQAHARSDTAAGVPGRRVPGRRSEEGGVMASCDCQENGHSVAVEKLKSRTYHRLDNDRR